MKYVRLDNSETNITITTTLDASDLKKVKAKTLKRLAKHLKVAGFRAGKVPAAVAEKNLDPNTLQAEVAQDSVNEFLFDVVDAEKIRPLDKPKVEITKYVPNEGLEFKAEVEILPTIKLGDYKKLAVKKEPIKVEDKDVDEVIERMRLGMAEKTNVDREAKSGDEVWIDFEGKKDGEIVGSASGKDYPLSLGSSTFIPGFEDGLIGKKTGDKFDLPLTFPKDYHHKPLAGAEVVFSVIVKDVKEVKLPDVDDGFAAKCGPFKTVEELRKDITRELTDQKEREALEQLKDKLLEKLVGGSSIPVPEILIQDQIASLERDFAQNLLYRGMTLEQYLEDQGLDKDAWLDKELRPQAIRRVEVGLVLAELSKQESIEVSAKEIESRLAELMQQYGKDDGMRQQLDTPEVKRDLSNRLITEKTINRLVDLNSK